MVPKGKKIWLDGEMLNWDEANVHVLTHGLHYGTSVYEGIRAYKLSSGGGAIFRLKDHMTRFIDSCRILQLQPKYGVDELCDIVLETVRANELDECYIRPLAWTGVGAMGLFADNPTSVMIAAWPWGAYLGDDALNNGVKVHVSTYNRHHPNISMIRAKIGGQYVTGVLAKREAQAHGYHEAIMLDTHGYVAEGSGEKHFRSQRRRGLYSARLFADSSGVHAGLHHATAQRSRYRGPKRAVYPRFPLHLRRNVPYRHGSGNHPGQRNRPQARRKRQTGTGHAEDSERVLRLRPWAKRKIRPLAGPTLRKVR